MSVASTLVAPFAGRIADQVMPPRSDDNGRDPRILDSVERKRIERKEKLGYLAIGLGVLTGIGVVYAVTAKAPHRPRPSKQFRAMTPAATSQPVLVEAVS